MQKIGINERHFAMYQAELGAYLQEQMMTLMTPKVNDGKVMGLE